MQCFQCRTFQCQQRRVDKTKTQRTMRCRICGARQSIRKVFAVSSKAKDVRKVVQKLNLARGSAEEEMENRLVEGIDGEACVNEDEISFAQASDMAPEERNNESGSLLNGKSSQQLAGREAASTLSGEETEDEDEVYTTTLPDEPVSVKRKRKGPSGGISKRWAPRRGASQAKDGVGSQWRAGPVNASGEPLDDERGFQPTTNNDVRGDHITFTTGDDGSTYEEERIL